MTRVPEIVRQLALRDGEPTELLRIEGEWLVVPRTTVRRALEALARAETAWPSTEARALLRDLGNRIESVAR